jgi:FkbM family methyltransferase
MSSFDGSLMMRRQSRFRRFLQKPWREKVKAVLYRWVQAFPHIPVPVRLSFGRWWLARNDFIGAALFSGGFESTECSFVERFLRPGMIVVDIGAHHGFYTLLASRKVGSQGRVLAVEASPRERQRLELHLRINRCRNVRVEDCALGESEGHAQLHLVLGGQTGCNSLRQPEVFERTLAVPVRIDRLDSILHACHFEKVDFVKLDVEGGELSVLKGGPELLRRQPRPVILVEVQEIRTKPWGYPARDIVHFLSCAGYLWFRPLPNGNLEGITPHEKEYDGNFVAVPEEQVSALTDMIIDTTGTASIAAPDGDGS